MIYDVAVLGGGASGMMAAIQAARQDAKVLIVEGNDILGKKILATGNGKCNFSNMKIDVSCYFGGNPAFLTDVFSHFFVEETLSFFGELGIEPYAKDGLLYPRSRQASAVSEVLQREIKRLKITVACGEKVSGIKKQNSVFEIKTENNRFQSKRVILAMGGQASAIQGSNGDGYYYAEQFGHHIIPIMPALVQLHINDSKLVSLAGVRCDASVCLMVDGEQKRMEIGELQLTQHGISGIVVFQLSRIASYALQKQQKVCAILDFLPEKSIGECETIIRHRFCKAESTVLAKEALIGLLHDRLSAVLLERSNIAPNALAKDISAEQLSDLVRKIKQYAVTVTDTHGFKNAQVTAGGIDVSDINPHTMESKHVAGLYFAGEIIDVDGICGGYNLQWAWSSGAIAGKSATKGIL